MITPDPPAIRNLVLATDVDVLAADKEVSRRDGYWRIASPGDPTFWWGNLLIFDDPPVDGDRRRWQQLFEQEFGNVDGIAHRTFAWDRADGTRGAAASEFPPPYAVEETVGLTALPAAITEHPRANRELTVRALRPQAGADEDLWAAVLELQLAQMASEPWAAGLADAYTGGYRRRRNAELREIFQAGRGAWYVGLLEGEVAGSLGIVVTGGRARYQSVDTAERFRDRGVATRLVTEAARMASAAHHIDQFVIAADPGYHAIRIYESVGFARTDRSVGVLLRPQV